jgi:hypothetical protein
MVKHCVFGSVLSLSPGLVIHRTEQIGYQQVV